jgi:hypothetical protein
MRRDALVRLQYTARFGAVVQQPANFQNLDVELFLSHSIRPFPYNPAGPSVALSTEPPCHLQRQERERTLQQPEFSDPARLVSDTQPVGRREN